MARAPLALARKLSRKAGSRLGLLVAVALLGCAPEIGDKCETSVDCSQLGDRLCDISQPEGYCTVYNCEPKSSNAATKCPDEAACIAFAVEPSPVQGCESRLGATPYSRTFCMKTCDNTNDCRKGYICVDLGAPGNIWAAVDADGPTKVCTQPFSAAPLPPRDPGVCTGTSYDDTPDAGEVPSGGGTSSEAGGGGAGAAEASSSGGVGG